MGPVSADPATSFRVEGDTRTVAEGNTHSGFDCGGGGCGTRRTAIVRRTGSGRACRARRAAAMKTSPGDAEQFAVGHRPGTGCGSGGAAQQPDLTEPVVVAPHPVVPPVPLRCLPTGPYDDLARSRLRTSRRAGRPRPSPLGLRSPPWATTPRARRSSACSSLASAKIGSRRSRSTIGASSRRALSVRAASASGTGCCGRRREHADSATDPKPDAQARGGDEYPGPLQAPAAG